MLSLLLTLVVILVVAGLVYWALTTLAAAFGLPAQVTAVLQVLLVILVVIALLSYLLPGIPHALR